MLKWQIWRALRLMMDTGLHFRGLLVYIRSLLNFCWLNTRRGYAICFKRCFKVSLNRLAIQWSRFIWLRKVSCFQRPLFPGIRRAVSFPPRPPNTREKRPLPAGNYFKVGGATSLIKTFFLLNELYVWLLLPFFANLSESIRILSYDQFFLYENEIYYGGHLGDVTGS